MMSAVAPLSAAKRTSLRGYQSPSGCRFTTLALLRPPNSRANRRDGGGGHKQIFGAHGQAGCRPSVLRQYQNQGLVRDF